jgi:glycine oxidase
VKVVVIGAGIIGVSIADAMAARGADVTVLDMRSPGRGASHASAGILAPYTEAHGNEPMLALGTRSLAMFDAYLSRLESETGRRIEYGRTGTLEVALDASGLESLRTLKRDLDGYGALSDLLDAHSLRAVEPCVTRAALGGLLTRPHGFVGVESLMTALLERARVRGAIFESPVEVVDLEARRDVVEIRAGGSRRDADAAVIATGSWSRRVRVKNVTALPIRPVRGQLLHLQWTARERPSRVVWGPRCYAVPWSDGSLLVGATLEDVGFDEATTVSGVRDLTTAVVELLPEASVAHLGAVRVGLRPASPDGQPAIGPLDRAPRVVIATGHYRNGILLAPLTADLVARYLLDGIEDEAFRLTSPNRFLA